MVRTRHGWHVVVLGLALVLALALVSACKKDEKKDTAPGDQTAEKAEKPGVAPSTAGGAKVDDLSLLPLDSELVLGLNFAQIQQSALWKQFVQPKLMDAETQAKIAEFKTKCDLDPMASVATASVGLKGLGGPKPDGIIVVHGLNKSKTLACLDKMKEDIAKNGGEFTRDGDVVVGKNKAGDQMAAMFINDSTVVLAVGEKANADGVKAAAAGGSTLKSSAPFLDMYGKVKTSDSLWFLINGNAKIFEKAAAMGVKPKAMFGSLNVTDGLALDMRMRLDTPDAASQLANMGKAQMQQAAKMFDQVDITADGSDVKVTIVLSNQKLQGLISQFGAMFGAFGGGTP